MSRKSSTDKLNEFCVEQNLHNFEGHTGVRNLEKIIKAIGYDNINDFLADNPGAIAAILDWIGIHEWDWEE